MPVGLDEHCQVTVGSDVFVIGGLIRNGGSSAVSTVYKLSDGIWTIFSSIKTPRRKHMCSVLNGTIYVMGGVGYPVSGYFSSVEMLTPASNDWVVVSQFYIKTLYLFLEVGLILVLVVLLILVFTD